MMKHKVKYRVVGADKTKRKYSINLDEGTSFQLSRELLQGAPAQEGSKPLCALVIQNNVLVVRAGADQNDIVLNGKPNRESEVKPGDLVQVGEFSIEILECPHTVRNETNATQFLDVSEMFPASQGAAPVHQTKTVEHVRESSSTPAPEENAAAASSLELDKPAEAPAAAPAPAQNLDMTGKWSSRRWDEAPAEKAAETHAARESHPEETPISEEPTRVSPSPKIRSTFRDQEHSTSSRSNRQMERSSERHSERHSERKAARRVEPARKSRSQSSTMSIDPDFSHFAISGALAAVGVAAAARILINGTGMPQGTTLAIAALASLPAVFGAAWGLQRANDFINSKATMKEYARFLGWAMICSVPWAYTMAASFPVAIFTTLLTTVLVSVAFIARFHPELGRFAGVGAGFSATALAALVSTHHFMAKPPLDNLTADTETTAPAATQPAQAQATTPVAAPVGNVAVQPLNGAAPAGQPAQLGQPQAAAPVQAPGANTLAQQAAPSIPSAVNDTIPPIPQHADLTTTNNRVPAAADPGAKGIVDPLAHEEFFSAIRQGNLEVVKSLIDRKSVDPDFTLDKGSTPLIVAAAAGRQKVVEYLIRRRVNINAQDPHGTTALMWAVFKGHRDVAKYLIGRGADTKVIRDDGDTAMDIARKWKQGEIVALLKEAQANDDDSSSSRRSKSRSKRRRSSQ